MIKLPHKIIGMIHIIDPKALSAVCRLLKNIFYFIEAYLRLILHRIYRFLIGIEPSEYDIETTYPSNRVYKS